MATATRPRDPFRSPLAEAMRAQARRAVESGPAHPRLAAPALRLACVLLAGAYALDRWFALVDRPPAGVVGASVAVALVVGLALLGAGRRLTGARAALAASAILAIGIVAVLAAAGATDLAPRRWGALASGLAGGVGALPGLTVPYRGADDWARVVLCAAGCLLLLIAAAAATWPRRPAPGSRLTAVAALGVLFAVPAIELTDDHPYRAGALFALALAATLYAERLRPRQAPLAAAAVLLAVAAGLVIGPRLDASQPLVDVQELAGRLESRGGLRFSWEHRYGPLNWPREGRVVARIGTSVGAYWKAETLEDFDGRRWVAAPPSAQRVRDPTPHAEWRETIRVAFGDLRSAQFLGAGTTTYVFKAPEQPVRGTAGAFVTQDRPLGPGAAYRAVVYYPRPSERQMRRAGIFYDEHDVGGTLRLTVPRPEGGDADVLFPAWSGVPLTRNRGGLLTPGGRGALRASPYAGVYALARRLRAGARTPFDYAARVRRYLASSRFTYDESPSPARAPLAAFLLDQRRGYCQQFSGAMALLLRMGGVPARVATGFSPGTADTRHGEYVVRDIDAHSWVEVLFPNIGWVTFDPTPQVAPARSQLGDALAGLPNPSGDRPLPTGRETSGGPGDAGKAAAGGGDAWWRGPLVVVAVVLVLVAIAAGLAVARLERRRHPATAPELAELERALRRAGRDTRPPTTLRDLERLLGPDERATAYVRAVRDARYAERARPPSRGERAALRRALGDGLGTRGRLRALWALPPRLRDPGRGLH